jgi:hypothetical protein
VWENVERRRWSRYSLNVLEGFELTMVELASTVIIIIKYDQVMQKLKRRSIYHFDKMVPRGSDEKFFVNIVPISRINFSSMFVK